MDLFVSMLSVISGSAITLGIVKWTGGLVSNKLLIQWKEVSTKEVEKLKSEATIRNDLLRTTLESFSTANTYNQEIRINSIRELWKSVMLLREKFAPLMTFYTVLLPKEYNQVIEERPTIFGIQNTNYSTIGNLSKDMQKTEELRPFIGEYLWSLYQSYYAFISRNIFLFNKQADDGDIKPWYFDKHLKEMAETILEDTVSIDVKKMDSLQVVSQVFQHKILREMEEMLSGKRELNSNVEEAKKLLILAKDIENDTFNQ